MSSARGTVIKRGATYSVVLDLGRDDAGKRIRKWHAGFKTKKAAEQDRTEMLGKLDTGTYIEPSTVTIKQFLTDQWLPAIATTVRPTTLAMYRVNLDSHVIPSLGSVQLRELSAPRLNAYYASLLADGRRDGKGGLSTRTIRINHVIIHRALRDAVRWGLLSRNVAELADPPAVKSTEAAVWSPDEMKQFLDGQQTDRLTALWRLVTATGMRRGEVLGLRWSDVDFETGSLRIAQTLVVVNYALQLSEPKTSAGKRTLMIDPATIAALRAHRKRQLEEQLAWSSNWKNSEGLVFVREDGSMIHPERLSKWFDQRVTAAKLPRITFHGLRHSYVTMLLRGGQPIRAVSARVGHASANVTNAIYSHVLPGDDEVAALAGAALLGG
jgi:integrase